MVSSYASSSDNQQSLIAPYFAESIIPLSTTLANHSTAPISTGMFEVQSEDSPVTSSAPTGWPAHFTWAPVTRTLPRASTSGIPAIPGCNLGWSETAGWLATPLNTAEVSLEISVNNSSDLINDINLDAILVDDISFSALDPETEPHRAFKPPQPRPSNLRVRFGPGEMWVFRDDSLYITADASCILGDVTFSELKAVDMSFEGYFSATDEMDLTLRPFERQGSQYANLLLIPGQDSDFQEDSLYLEADASCILASVTLSGLGAVDMSFDYFQIDINHSCDLITDVDLYAIPSDDLSFSAFNPDTEPQRHFKLQQPRRSNLRVRFGQGEVRVFRDDSLYMVADTSCVLGDVTLSGLEAVHLSFDDYLPINPKDNVHGFRDDSLDLEVITSCILGDITLSGLDGIDISFGDAIPAAAGVDFTLLRLESRCRQTTVRLLDVSFGPFTSPNASFAALPPNEGPFADGNTSFIRLYLARRDESCYLPDVEFQDEVGGWSFFDSSPDSSSV